VITKRVEALKNGIIFDARQKNGGPDHKKITVFCGELSDPNRLVAQHQVLRFNTPP